MTSTVSPGLQPAIRRRSAALQAEHGTESTRWLVVVTVLVAPGLRGTEIRKLTSASPLGSSTTTGTLVSRPTSRTSLAPSSPTSAGGAALAGEPSRERPLRAVAVVLRVSRRARCGHSAPPGDDCPGPVRQLAVQACRPCGQRADRHALWTFSGQAIAADGTARQHPEMQKWGHPKVTPLPQCLSGGVLLSHNLSVAVPSALKGLTSGFGMGPGVSRFAMAAVTLSTSYKPPQTCCAGLGLLVGNCLVDANNVCVQVWLGVCVRWFARRVCVTCVVLYVVGTSPRPISTGRLGITAVHLRPINPMFCGGPYPIIGWETSS